MTQLWLVRHGQSEGNRNHCFLGRQDPPLTEFGRSQMNAIKVHLPESPDRVFTSPLKRAWQSAELLFPGGFKMDCRLVEQDFGRWEGLTRDEAERQDFNEFSLWAKGDPKNAPPDGESLFSVRSRLDSWLAEFLQGPLLNQTVVVAHGGLLQTLSCALLNIPLSNHWPFVFQQGGIAHFRFSGPQAQLIAFYPGP